MNKETAEKLTSELVTPIKCPLSLYFRKSGKWVDNYDIVTHVEVLNHSVNVHTGRKFIDGDPIIENHSFDSFDEMVVIDEGQW